MQKNKKDNNSKQSSGPLASLWPKKKTNVSPNPSPKTSFDLDNNNDDGKKIDQELVIKEQKKDKSKSKPTNPPS